MSEIGNRALSLRRWNSFAFASALIAAFGLFNVGVWPDVNFIHSIAAVLFFAFILVFCIATVCVIRVMLRDAAAMHATVHANRYLKLMALTNVPLQPLPGIFPSPSVILPQIKVPDRAQTQPQVQAQPQAQSQTEQQFQPQLPAQTQRSFKPQAFNAVQQHPLYGYNVSAIDKLYIGMDDVMTVRGEEPYQTARMVLIGLMFGLAVGYATGTSDSTPYGGILQWLLVGTLMTYFMTYRRLLRDARLSFCVEKMV